MDIITTGVAKSSPERIKSICDLIRNLYVSYFIYFCYIQLYRFNINQELIKTA
jgi:hypothetical protein